MLQNKGVLTVGIYFLNRETNINHISGELSSARNWVVSQRWAAIGGTVVPNHLSEFTRYTCHVPKPKFELINILLSDVTLDDYEYVLVCDDDIECERNFLDRYLVYVKRYDFALAQPARTHDSFIDHMIVERMDDVIARRTRFVEIGPLFSLRYDAYSVLLPFEESSPMGWGYDFVWPVRLEAAGLKLGIVDAVPVAHRLRKPVAHYSFNTAHDEMTNYLKERKHLTRDEAFRVMEKYD